MNFEIADKSTEIKSNWDEARLYCFSLGEGWRLPTEVELNHIYLSTNDFESTTYWSSLEVDLRSAQCQDFKRGYQFLNYLKLNHHYVRAVRTNV